MPRPTPAQLAYGSITVVCSTFAMLMLSGVTSGAGIMVIAVAALALGLLVALTAPMAHTARGERGGASTSKAAPVTRIAATGSFIPLRRGGSSSGAGAPRTPQVSVRR